MFFNDLHIKSRQQTLNLYVIHGCGRIISSNKDSGANLFLTAYAYMNVSRAPSIRIGDTSTRTVQYESS